MICTTLADMVGHQQQATLIQTENAIARIAKDTVKQH
jgi:hypothetical protein